MIFVTFFNALLSKTSLALLYRYYGPYGEGYAQSHRHVDGHNAEEEGELSLKQSKCLSAINVPFQLLAVEVSHMIHHVVIGVSHLAAVSMPIIMALLLVVVVLFIIYILLFFVPAAKINAVCAQ